MCKCWKNRQQEFRLSPGTTISEFLLLPGIEPAVCQRTDKKSASLLRTRLFLFPDCFFAFSYGLMTVTPFMYFLSASGTSMEPSSC